MITIFIVIMVTIMKKLGFILLIWVFVYPLVLAVNTFQRDYFYPWPVYIQTAISTLILVPTIVFIVVPTVNRILERCTTQLLKEAFKMNDQEKYCVFATIPVKSEFAKDAERAILDIISCTLAEPGCEIFTFHKDSDSTISKFYLYERFTDEKAFQFHHDQEYTKAVYKKYENWLAGPVEIIRMSRLSPEE